MTATRDLNDQHNVAKQMAGRENYNMQNEVESKEAKILLWFIIRTKHD